MGANNSTVSSTSMGGMIGTFSTSTRVTLFFSDWTTDTPAKYFGTLIFLFVVTLLNRFLGAWRSQLGHKWANDAADARRKVEQRRAYKHAFSRAKVERQSSETCFDEEGAESSTEKAPLSPYPLGVDVEAGEKKRDGTPMYMAVFGGRWRAGNPWRVNIDVPRALLEGIRALIGYLLMLAVMTFNLGFLLVVILGIVAGELILGRYISGTGWEEGGCHDG
ncbi:uncharacterized protein CC84DRAFT_1181990 [Paraphaeosphaeria sporulosa]|uniref:Copper transport protein n=1 Tax=Paraphaeosphaeria sporulosa TaxID=1460663 RepID=A0A177BUA2_9PLEO|nr:uncharacterized protein CC84DRAFT_1181990 [Paraphaeosphaeria sporulosa]OAF98844.1 hypothetical protein CC84DRAFT_1181990 [Paraphaeosphaeria sporulosa]